MMFNYKKEGTLKQRPE